MKFDREKISAISAYALIGAAIGLHVGFSDDPRLLAATAMIPVLWHFAPSRYAAAALAIAYYLAVARGVPQGAATFFGDGNTHSLLLGITLWLVSSAVLALPWAALWQKRTTTFNQALRLFAIYTLITIPPIGLFGWASPLLAAGILFPNSSWLGLAALTVAPVIFHTMCSNKRKVVSATLPCVFVIYIALRAYIIPIDIQSPDGFTALHTPREIRLRLGTLHGFLHSHDRHNKQSNLAKNVVYPSPRNISRSMDKSLATALAANRRVHGKARTNAHSRSRNIRQKTKI